MARNLLALGATPPGLHVDEASVGYNAWTIAHHGVDEHGVHWPLFFEAFGEYKNPLYIYLLAGVFKLAGPGVLTERRLSALLGWLYDVSLLWMVTAAVILELAAIPLIASTARSTR